MLDIDIAGDDGAGVGNVGDTITGGERERAWASYVKLNEGG
jgi:hypothetical protein